MMDMEPHGLLYTTIDSQSEKIYEIKDEVCIKCYNNKSGIQKVGFEIIKLDNCKQTLAKKKNLFSEL